MNNDETCLIFDLIHSSPNLKNKKNHKRHMHYARSNSLFMWLL